MKLKKYYIEKLQKLCRRELKKIGDISFYTIDELIEWHDFMAINCINCENESQKRILKICVQTAKKLEELKWL